MLYEVGDYVNRNGRHRHTHYILANSEMAGYTPSNGSSLPPSPVTWADATAACRRPNEIASAAEQEHVRKAICLCAWRELLTWDAATRRSVRVYARGANVKLTLVPSRHGCGPGALAIEKEQLYFRELFGRTLSAAVE